MNQDGNSPRRFIFSDEFYDSLNNETKAPNQQENIPNPITQPVDPYEALVTPQPALEINRNVSNGQVKPTETENKFFSNQVIETTTVYDNVGNTISKTVVDSTKPDEIIEEVKAPVPEEKKEEKEENILGIPTANDMPELTQIEIPKIEEEMPSIVEKNNDINLNVETGINKSLEKELMKNKDVYAPEPIDPDNEYYNMYHLKPPVQKYHAVRRKINPITLEEDNIPDSTPSVVKPIENLIEDEPKIDNWQPSKVLTPIEITEEVNYEEPLKEEKVTKSDLLSELREKEKKTGKISILARYGDDFTSHDYITNPAIGRDREIKELGLILLTPEKSAILVGKPGIGKTSIVEGLAYQLQRDNVPDALKGYRIISVKTTSLLGSLTDGETRLQTLIDELKVLDKIILFVDEVHMLMGATNESSLDFANMFKESLGRGSIKMIGATTSEEYERYVLRDKAFVRRFQRVDVNEPNREETIEILMGTLPKIEKTTGAKLKYTHFIKTEIMGFIVDITTEYKRVYGIGSRYPDICITLLNQAFSQAVFDNRTEVNIFDIRSAIEHSKNIYPDVIRKELVNFDNKFKNIIDEEKNNQ